MHNQNLTILAIRADKMLYYSLRGEEKAVEYHNIHILKLKFHIQDRKGHKYWGINNIQEAHNDSKSLKQAMRRCEELLSSPAIYISMLYSYIKQHAGGREQIKQQSNRDQ